MSLAIGASCIDGVILLTDSAVTEVWPDGRRVLLKSKTWSLGDGNVQMAACGSFQVQPSPDQWPISARARSFSKFEMLCLDLEEQLATGEITSGSKDYEVLVAGGEPQSFPKLARITHNNTEWAAPGSVMLASVAHRVKVPDHVPATLTDCQDLMIVMAAKAIAHTSDEPRDPDAGPVVAWPLRVTTWRYQPSPTKFGWWTDKAETVVKESSFEEIERRWWAYSAVAQAAPRLRAGLVDSGHPPGARVSFGTEITPPPQQPAKGDE